MRLIAYLDIVINICLMSISLSLKIGQTKLITSKKKSAFIELKGALATILTQTNICFGNW